MRTVVALALFAALAPAADPLKYEVEMTNDVAYRDDKDADKTRHKLDVIVPKGKKDFPVLFFIHGGAWKMGDKMSFSKPAKQFAEHGIGVVCPNYRLTPAVKHPGHIEDVAKAFAWTVENIGKYGGDAKKIVVGGHSAGGHLAALLATNDDYLKAEKRELSDVRGVVGVSGVYVIDPRVKLFHDMFGDDEKVCKTASPIEHVSADRPPMLLAYGDKDLLGLPDGAEAFAKALGKATADAAAREYKGRDHFTIMSDMKKADDPLFRDAKDFILKVTK
ncbi:MAG: alpha/beta hydrolase [Fimbriiglobus sp.]|jgi:acetyl esterase/lipase|nr:alpha/beta hydrolase [Fimbriiglobus sp.]